MKKHTYTRGFSAVIAIVVIAILAVGGYTAVRYAQKNQTELSVEETSVMTTADSQAKLRADLESLEEILNSSLGLDAKIQATNDFVADMKITITEAKETASAEALAQLDVLDDQITELQVEVQSDIEAAKETVNEIISSVEASFEAEGQAEVNSGDTSDDETMTDGDSDSETSISGEVDAELDI